MASAFLGCVRNSGAAVTDLSKSPARCSGINTIRAGQAIEGHIVDDTLTLRFDFTDYIRRPNLDEQCTNTYPASVADAEDALAPARGVLAGLACTLPFWVLVFVVAM